MKKTFFIWIDALRADYLDKMPFLKELSSKYNFGSLIPPLGYRALIDFYTGSTAEIHNQFAAYGYTGKNLNRYRILKKIAPRKYLYHFIDLIRYYKKQSLIQKVNPKYLSFFEPSNEKNYYLKDSLSVPTIFDKFREGSKKFLIYDWPQVITEKKNSIDVSFGDDKTKTDKFLSLAKKERDIYFIHFLDLDEIGHKFGPESEEMEKVLLNEDNCIRKIFSELRIEENNFLIFSDHGMLNVKETFDLKAVLPEFNKGYIYFLDSTMARFWFFDEGVKRQVLEILKNCKKGHLLTEKEKGEHNLNFKDNFYGDEIFLADSGVLILPNFFQNNLIKGVHGYDFSDKNEKTVFITNLKTKKEFLMRELHTVANDLIR
jgi:predicted AlkP superfamily pyrophosphatase or phosphodiesterase